MQFNIIFIAIGLLTATSSARRTKTSYTATAAVIMTRHVCADLQTALESELLVTYRPTVKVPDETKVPRMPTVMRPPILTRIMTEWSDLP
ncbi:hypothetical protein HBI56_110380 [Parastagonospora nodorum]|uniref:Uncharacterized protein n=1 Tax=Phaeosphaeria nodorum (strain SN15 / ATCC MYA-4574 / FGSC 10173) TaxID=321614 RepID=A0A7U2ETV5_PHANO|nr:hypothetical protein HBH56_042910 [Parastagonospora nodorum]QRC92889.1 hypothetical protein JI435_428670 [Parastagonospora nodorum SN15]KAH3932866.1 hypothetical protein HBH54_070660 [Parastagonospora nodorum]KAH3943497.1 hypothetical protein HBH53_174830 [Parastagonospora nodorum]KAH4102259.1 hypothetical protein HBH46_129420 [Parastagonospora nodorum]